MCMYDVVGARSRKAFASSTKLVCVCVCVCLCVVCSHVVF